MREKQIEKLKDYKYGFTTDIENIKAPKGLNENKILDVILPEKDVDGLHPINVGKLLLGSPNFIPCTPNGCIEILPLKTVDMSQDIIPEDIAQDWINTNRDLL